MKKIIFFLIIGSIFGSCNMFKSNQKHSDYVVFSLEKTGCYGKCPVYNIEIYESGKVDFEGLKNVDNIGKYTKTIDQKEVKSLIAEFVNVNFFDFQDEYTANITDLPTTFISFTNNGKTKKIRDYYGAPKILRDLEKMLENIANSKDWTKCD